MRRTFVIFGVLTFLGLVFMLKMRNEVIALEKKPNGFKRSYLKCSIELVNKINIEDHWKTLAGADQDIIYLSGDTAGVFLITDINLHKTSRMDIGLSPSLRRSIGPSFSALADREYFNISPFNSPKLISFNRNQRRSSTILMTAGVCSSVTGTNSSKLYIRKYEPGIQDQSFFCLNTSNAHLYPLKDFLPIFHDGGLSTDGQLNWDNSTKHLIYHCFYKNTYFVIDSLFLDIKEFHSIDTFRSARIHVIRQGQYFTSEGNNEAINKYSAVFRGWLFLLSTLRGDNETVAQFESGSSLDIYDYSKGEYLGSIKMPDFNGEKVRQFLVIKGRIYALYSSALVQYQIANAPGTFNLSALDPCHLSKSS